MAEQESGKKTWIKACGIGCLVLVVLGIAGAIGVYLLAQKAMEAGAEAVAMQLEESYGTAKENGKVPEEHVALFDEIVEIATRDGASLWVAMTGTSAVLTALEDGEVDEEEVEMATAIRDFIKANPNAGLKEFTAFAEEHPELQERLQSIQSQLQPKP
jgi:predicted negative regulator of RcsB-dependent stress response